jgi:tetratricopeptide (TPR) repeat protein
LSAPDLTLFAIEQEIETWVRALGHYDNNEFEEALKAFDDIADTSKILFNCGVIYATLGEHYKAVGGPQPNLSAMTSRIKMHRILIRNAS